MKRLQQTLFLISLALCGASVAADAGDTEEIIEAVNVSIRETIAAKQISRTAPRYPGSQLRRGREAWVHVTYCIDETGTVQNSLILDSIGNDTFDRAALDAVQKWEFEPALQDGKPVWQSRNEVYINFALADSNLGASRKFVRQFRKINDLLSENNLEAADELFWTVYNNYDLSLYELGKLWAQRVRYEASKGDYYRLTLALDRATALHGSWIEKNSYMRLLTLLVKVEIRLGKYHEALHTFNDLVDATSENSDEVVSLRPTIDQLKSMIEGESILQIPAEIRTRGDCTHCNDSWNFTPIRNDFTFSNIQGKLKSIDMRCDHKRFESIVSDEVEWHIPQDWGRCHIQVYGEPGTTFDVFMLPAD